MDRIHQSLTWDKVLSACRWIYESYESEFTQLCPGSVAYNHKLEYQEHLIIPCIPKNGTSHVSLLKYVEITWEIGKWTPSDVMKSCRQWRYSSSKIILTSNSQDDENSTMYLRWWERCLFWGVLHQLGCPQTSLPWKKRGTSWEVIDPKLIQAQIRSAKQRRNSRSLMTNNHRSPIRKKWKLNLQKSVIWWPWFNMIQRFNDSTHQKIQKCDNQII